MRLKSSDDLAVFYMELAQGHRSYGGHADVRGLHRAAGTQAGRAHSEPLGSKPRWAVRPAAAAGGWSKTFPQGRSDSDGGVSATVSHFSGNRIRMRADFNCCGPLRLADRNGPGRISLF